MANTAPGLLISTKATRGVASRGRGERSLRSAGRGRYQCVAHRENGINVITESERKGSPRELFWPWFGANVSVLGLAYGAFILGFGISFWQALIVGFVGIVISFLLCGVISLAGKRASRQR